jgi:hypothetical protein
MDWPARCGRRARSVPRSRPLRESGLAFSSLTAAAHQPVRTKAPESGSVDVIKRLRPTRSAQSLKAGRESRGRDSDSGTFDPVVVRAGRDRVWAGQTLVGGGPWCARPVSVDLVRIEQTPSGQRLHSCQQATAVSAWSATDTNPARATFELEVPDDAVPSARGAQCSRSYALRACLQGAGPGRHWAAVEVIARGQANVERRFQRFDRSLPASRRAASTSS